MGLVVAYYVTARIGLAFAIPPGNATAVWPASGIAVGTLIIFGWRICAGIWIAGFLMSMTTDVSPWTASAFATGNTLEALLATWLCRRYLALDQPFRRIQSAFIFLAIAAVASTIAATFGVVALMYGKYVLEHQFLSNWSTWWLGDLTGIMLVTPVLICIRRGDVWPEFSSKTAESLLSITILGLVSHAIFGGGLPENVGEGLLYLPLIVLFWLLLRFDSSVAFIGNLFVASVAVWGTSRNAGAFASEAAANSLFDLQIFMNVYALTTLALAGILSSSRDAENRKAASLAETNSHLAHLGRVSAMGEMASAMAHELNQPLASIAGNSQACVRALRNGMLSSEEVLEALGEITSESLRAGKILHGISRFVADRPPNRETVDVNEIVRQTEVLLEAEMQRMEANIEFNLNAHLPKVEADFVQIQQVLINLVRNSIDAMRQINRPQRRVTISSSHSGSDVFVCVCDNGKAFEGDSPEEIFEPYFTTKPGGLGMGLAICRTIINAHGGRLTASRNAEHGMTIAMALPTATGRIDD